MPFHGILHDGHVALGQVIDRLFLLRREDTFALRKPDDGESRLVVARERLWRAVS